MGDDSVDKAHEDAVAEDFDRGVMAEINRLGREYAGARVVMPVVYAKAAFWLKVYTELTDHDPVAVMALMELVRRLHVGIMDSRRFN